MRKQITAGIFGAVLTLFIQGAYKEIKSSHYNLEGGMGALSILENSGILSLRGPNEDSALMYRGELMLFEKEGENILRAYLDGSGLTFFQKSPHKSRLLLDADSGSIILIDNKENKKIIE